MSTNKPPTDPTSAALDCQQAGPAALRILVGTRLRQLREAKRITRTGAAAAIRASESKISRLELGRTGFKQRDVGDLLTLYGLSDDEERTALLALAKQANSRCWWHTYSDLLSTWFEPYLGLEQAACLIRDYQVQLVPDLLQAKAYGRSVLQLIYEDASESELERRLSLLIERQKILYRSDDPAKLWAVIDQGALRRPIGTARTMRAQIEHLIAIAELPNVTIQMLPFSAGGHPAVGGGPITYLRFPQEGVRDSVCLEQLTSAHYPEKLAEIDRYWHIMNRLALRALSPAKTVMALHAFRHGI